MNLAFILATSGSFVIGIIIGMALKEKGFTTAKVLAILVSLLGLGLHTLSLLNYQVQSNIPYIFDIIWAMAIGSSMGFSLTDVLNAIKSKIQP